jgi:predicted metalloprotease with PDZ domain
MNNENEFEEYLESETAPELTTNDNQLAAPTGDPLAGYDPAFVNDIRRTMDQQAQAIHAEYAPILSATVANQAAQLVASDLGNEVQQYITKTVSQMDPRAARAMMKDPAGLEMLQNLALGYHSKRANETRVLRTNEPGGSESEAGFSPSDRASLNSFMQAFGVDRKRATELFRQAQGQGR